MAILELRQRFLVQCPLSKHKAIVLELGSASDNLCCCEIAICRKLQSGSLFVVTKTLHVLHFAEIKYHSWLRVSRFPYFL